MGVECLFAFVLGTVIGSFLNVCIYRIPKGKSIVYPPSFCPSCKRPIKWYDNVPVVSYILLRGKCRHCKSPISLRYPIVELLTGATTAAVTCKFGPTFDTLYYLVLIYYLIVVAFIDLDTMEVPVKLSYFALLAGLFLSIPASIKFVDSMLGASFGAGVILFIIETYYVFTGKEGMGYGDANIMAVIGAFLGWKKVLLTLFFASLTGAVLGVTLMALRKSSKEQPLPFGPFLAAGALATLLAGDKLLNWYLHLLRG
jgi:leader peptidase (prepilin peptidase)/N-methyltransferase